MAKTSLKDIQVSAVLVFLKKNIGIVFSILLLLLFVGEGFIVKDSAAILTGGGPDIPQQNLSKAAVRVDFDDYNAAIKRIQDAERYNASSTQALPNPFGQGNP